VADPVMQLFEEYAGRFAAGERPDLREYLERAGEERDELALLVDRFLQWTDAPEPDEDAVALAQAWIEGEAPLVALRVRRGLTRDAVVDFVIETFRLDPAKREKVKRYYHQLETGQLQRQQVSERLTDALGKLFGTRIGDLLAWRPRPLAPEAAYFRATAPASVAPAAAPPGAPAERDQVDDLFTGGRTE
jgi:hypothetical protein